MATISRNSRFGYAHSNTPVQTPAGLEIDTPTTATTTGLGWRQLLDTHQKAARLNNGNDWMPVVFVGGEVVAAGVNAVRNLLSDLECG